MGREIRRVPAGWEHPREACKTRVGLPCEFDDSVFPARSRWSHQIGVPTHPRPTCPGDHFRPLYDSCYTDEARDYCDYLRLWLAGDLAGVQATSAGQYCSEEYFVGAPWDWTAPPDRDSHRESCWTADEATHYQMYETDGEGTPASPVFAALSDLADWLVGSMGYTRPQAEGFCESGWGPSFTVTRSPDGRTVLKDAVESAER